jgi:hypothetical protein
MKKLPTRLFEKLVDVRPEEIRARWLGFVFNFVVQTISPNSIP